MLDPDTGFAAIVVTVYSHAVPAGAAPVQLARHDLHMVQGVLIHYRGEGGKWWRMWLTYNALLLVITMVRNKPRPTLNNRSFESIKSRMVVKTLFSDWVISKCLHILFIQGILINRYFGIIITIFTSWTISLGEEIFGNVVDNWIGTNATKCLIWN